MVLPACLSTLKAKGQLIDKPQGFLFKYSAVSAPPGDNANIVKLRTFNASSPFESWRIEDTPEFAEALLLPRLWQVQGL